MEDGYRCHNKRRLRPQPIIYRYLWHGSVVTTAAALQPAAAQLREADPLLLTLPAVTFMMLLPIASGARYMLIAHLLPPPANIVPGYPCICRHPPTRPFELPVPSIPTGARLCCICNVCRQQVSLHPEPPQHITSGYVPHRRDSHDCNPGGSLFRNQDDRCTDGGHGKDLPGTRLHRTHQERSPSLPWPSCARRQQG